MSDSGFLTDRAAGDRRRFLIASRRHERTSADRIPPGSGMQSVRSVPLFVFAVLAGLIMPGSPDPSYSQDDNADENQQQDENADADQQQEEPELPKLEDMEIPTAEELLTGEASDWIVLQPDDKVLVVQPVYPRPKTLEKMEAKLEALRSASTRPERQADESVSEYRERIERLTEEAKYLTVVLPDELTLNDPNAAAEYRLNASRNVKQIIHHEDLMLRRADLLMNEGKLAEAFEMLLVLQRRFPDWPGYAQRRNRLIYEEATKRLRNEALEEALAYFEELYQLSPNYNGLKEGIGRTIEMLVSAAVADKQLRRARYYLTRLRETDKDHPAVKQLAQEFIDRAGGLIEQARQAREDERHRDAVLLAKQAGRVWPTHDSLRNIYRRTASRYQILSVGVYRFPDDSTSFFLPTAADRRWHSLLATDLFEVRKLDRAAFYESRYFEEWTPTDLGREIVFSLRPRRASWESNPVLNAPDVVRAIGDRLKPDSPYYNERLATFVRSMQVRSPHEFTLQFSTVPARPQALFRFPVRTPLAGGLADASPSGGLGGQGAVSVAKAPDAKAPDADGAGGNENGGGDPADSGDGDSGDGDSGDTNSGDENSGDTNSGDKDGGSTGSSDGTSSSNGQQSTGSTIGLDTILSRRFRIHEREEDRVAFRRVIPQPESLSRFHVAEIVERKYENHEEAIKGLLRGEVSVLPRVPVWLAPDFERDERFFTKTYGVPTTHVLQFNPESKPLQNAEFRRALAFVLNRRKILSETILKDPEMLRGRLVSAPFPSGSYAYNVQVKPRPYDLYLAYSLLTVSKKRFEDGIPELKLVCEPGEVIERAAQHLVRQWDRVGIKVKIVEQDAGTPEDWDIVYRTVRMTEPVTDLWPFLTMKSDARVEDLEHLPDWLRQQLIELEQAVDFNSAVQMLHRLHFRLNELVHVVPLWEIDDVIVIRNNVQGFPEGLIHPYQKVERWTVQASEPTDLL